MAAHPRARYQYIDNFLNKPGPTTDPDFVPGAPTIANLEASKVLVIGAGGLGCEILKNLAMSGFRDIHVIDMGTSDSIQAWFFSNRQQIPSTSRISTASSSSAKMM